MIFFCYFQKYSITITQVIDIQFPGIFSLLEMGIKWIICVQSKTNCILI